MIEIGNADDSYKLLKLLKDESRTLADLVSEFNSTFPPSLHFPLCSSLYIILEVIVLPYTIGAERIWLFLDISVV